MLLCLKHPGTPRPVSGRALTGHRCGAIWVPDLKQQLEEMRRQRDKEQDQAERLALALPAAIGAQTEVRGW